MDIDDLVVEVPNVPDTDDIAFDHQAWQDDLLKSEGYKARLQRKMLENAVDSWDQEGESALKMGKNESPLGYIRTVQTLLPKKVDIDVTATVSPTGIVQDSPRLRAIRSLLEAEMGLVSGPGGPEDTGEGIHGDIEVSSEDGSVLVVDDSSEKG